jgi:hypothetical protein
MLRFVKHSLLLSILVAGIQSASAFSLYGPLATWMDSVKGYPDSPGGGPMNLGEGYRWTLPTITYGFDPVFTEYFGSNGVYAIEQAIKILNDLPSASDIDLNKYPTSTTRENYRAGALRLRDLKSTALFMLLSEMGLVSPEAYVWTVRWEYHDQASVPHFWVIKRNFDPYTLEPSSYVNGVLYTYSITHTDTPHFGFAVPSPVDPLSPPFTTVISGPSLGTFFTGLTRDDVGGLRYLYRRNNMVVETVPPTEISPGGNGVVFVPGSGGSPWVPITTTNNINTNTPGGGTTNTTTYVNAALRQGREKLRFVRVNYDMVLGQFIPTTNAYTDTFFVNGGGNQQTLLHPVPVPDILFSAADNGIVQDVPVPSWRTGPTGVWTNNGALNGTPGPSTELDGPGIILPGITFSFSKIGRYFFNTYPNSVTEASSTPYFFWGSFDGSTNDPIVYPNGTSLRNLERQLFGN